MTAEPAPQRRDPFARVSDALNPILVREVQQAVKGRVFPLTILLALGVSVVIASVVASEEGMEVDGRGAFDAGLATLAPLLLFVVPMQAYNSMRTELKSGIVEQLLMSRLGPGRVLVGKLEAAMVQFVLYVSLLSPLLATSYLLRGVDLLTIVVSLLFALIACVAATAFAVSSAAQAVVPALQPIANLGVAFGLGLATFGAVVGIGSGEYAQGVGEMLRSRYAAAVMSGVALAAAVSTTLSWLTARSYLMHAFEDKSSGFRVFLWTLPLLVYGWMLAFIDSADWHEVFPVLTFGLLLAAIAWGIFMVTEQRPFSPRVRHHVPTGRMRSALAAPLLPGRDRGMLCFTLFAAALVGVALLFWPSSAGPFAIHRMLGRVGLMTLAYGAVYLNLGRWWRGLLPETVKASQAGRVFMPLLLFALIVVPLVIDALAQGYVDDWHLGHVMNPFWTISHFATSRWESAAPVVVAVLVAATLAQIPCWVRGVRETIRAAAARRHLAETGDAAPAAADGADD